MPTTQKDARPQNACKCRIDDVIEAACEYMEEHQVQSISMSELAERLERDFNQPFIIGATAMVKHVSLSKLIRERGWYRRRIRMRSVTGKSGTFSQNRWIPPAEVFDTLEIYATRKQK